MGPTIFQQNRQPTPYYWLCAVGLRVARALGAPADPYTNPEAALIAMRAVSLLLGLLVVALAWVAGALLSRSGEPWLMLFLPFTVALLPMHTFMATVVNDDIMAELAVSALFVALLALLRWPGGLRGSPGCTLCRTDSGGNADQIDCVSGIAAVACRWAAGMGGNSDLAPPGGT